MQKYACLCMHSLLLWWNALTLCWQLTAALYIYFFACNCFERLELYVNRITWLFSNILNVYCTSPYFLFFVTLFGTCTFLWDVINGAFWPLLVCKRKACFAPLCDELISERFLGISSLHNEVNAVLYSTTQYHFGLLSFFVPIKCRMLTCPQHRQLSLPGHNISTSPSPINLPKIKFSLNNHGWSCHSSSMYLNLKTRVQTGKVHSVFVRITDHVCKPHIHSLFKNVKVLLQQIVMILSV